MSQVKILTIKKEVFLILAQFAILLGIATIAPFLKQQAITGSIVNATLFISTVILGSQGAILVGLIPSVISLSVGLLPAAFFPMVPFIMVGNSILILTFSYLRAKNYWLGIFISSVFKFIFLFSTSSLVINLLLKKEVASQVAIMMSWPQLFTAFSGGLIAYIVLKTLKKV